MKRCFGTKISEALMAATGVAVKNKERMIENMIAQIKGI